MRRPAAVFLAIAPTALAQVPPQIGYQGRLLKADGTPETGVVTMNFLVYDAATAGSALGCESVAVALSDGYYSLQLGGVGNCLGNPPGIAPAAFDGRVLWLEVALGGTPMVPRQRIGSVPYALRAGTAANVRGGTIEATSAQIGGGSGVSITGSGITVGSTPIVDSAGKATVATGPSLTGNGSTASPLAVAYGNTAGTAAEGNDPRLSDARPPTAGSTSYIQNGTAAQNGNFNITGNGTVGGTLAATGTVSGSTLVSSAATGTAPLVVASTTAVANLNADAVDGAHFPSARGNNSATDIKAYIDRRICEIAFKGTWSDVAGACTQGLVWLTSASYTHAQLEAACPEATYINSICGPQGELCSGAQAGWFLYLAALGTSKTLSSATNLAWTGGGHNGCHGGHYPYPGAYPGPNSIDVCPAGTLAAVYVHDAGSARTSTGQYMHMEGVTCQGTGASQPALCCLRL